ncbi:type IV pilus modification protein PilV [Gilvimarinus sp. F26214L]|uniref:type IV pilus modification protein PilV n=1 Tax=Gilvimarinus sp. DZF01 TaxID=3461371 RepID=UPI0040466FC7
MSLTSLRKQSGIGLIEVLIAMIIFALGILGLASMQLSAKRTAYDALQRSIATNLARDVLERIRSNPSPAALAVYGAADEIGGATLGSEPTPTCSSEATECEPAQLATHDLWEWERALDGASETLAGNMAGGLVSPKACITNTNNVIKVVIAWKGSEGLQDAIAAEPCGQDLGLYGTDDKDRQLVVISTYVEQV